MKKILLHVCCGPCEVSPINWLQKHGYEPVLFFANPNIFPEEEYKKRLGAARGYAEKMELEFIPLDDRTFGGLHKAWLQFVGKSGNCRECWEYRLRKTAELAQKLKIENFTTTLLASPHQDIEYIRDLGNKLAKEHNLIFIYPDSGKKKFKGFRSGFTEGRRIAKREVMYSQVYCGCRPPTPPGAGYFPPSFDGGLPYKLFICRWSPASGGGRDHAWRGRGFCAILEL